MPKEYEFMTVEDLEDNQKHMNKVSKYWKAEEIQRLPTSLLKKLLFMSSDGMIEDIVAGGDGIRHSKESYDPVNYMKQWLAIFRCFGYATKDDSWGELEKEICVAVKRLVVAEREVANLYKKNKQLRKRIEKIEFEKSSLSAG